MADPKQTKSKTEEKSQTSGFNCCDGNLEDMFSKMQEFCKSKERSFDCCEMMHHMFTNKTNEPQK